MRLLLRQLLFVFLLFLSLLSTAFCEVVLTDQEANEIVIETEKSDKLLETNEIILQSSEKAIVTLQNNSTMTSESYEKIISLKESQITELEKSLKKQKTETILDKIYNFFLGALLGFSISTIIIMTTT